MKGTNTFTYHRRIGSRPATPIHGHRTSTASTTWGEKCLSLLLIVASILLGIAVVGSLMRPFLSGTSSTMQPVVAYVTGAVVPTATAATVVPASTAALVLASTSATAAVVPTATGRTAAVVPAATIATVVPAAKTAAVVPAATIATVVPAAKTAAVVPAATIATVVPAAKTAAVVPAAVTAAVIPAVKTAAVVPTAKTAVVVPPATAAVVPAVAASTAVAKPRTFPEPDARELARLRRAAKLLDPELMEQMPESFDPAVKNPCWTTPTGEFKCLPYFYITGQFHAGASTMHDKIRMHPDVLTDHCTGCQFWGEMGKPMSYYLEHMKESPKRIKEMPATRVLMDSSPSTFAFYVAAGGKAHRAFSAMIGPCFQECVGSTATTKMPVPECMDKVCYKKSLEADRKLAADAGIDYDTECHNPLLVRAVYGARPPKMILLARDPVQRLYSAYHGYPHYHGKYGRSAAGFTAYVKEQVDAINACAKDHGADRCAIMLEMLSSREEKLYFHADQLMRGMYGLWLEIWYRFIPPANWLVIHSDDYFNKPKDTLARVIDFLGLSRLNDTALEAAASNGKVTSFATGQQPIEPEARKLLLDLYRPYNTLLAQLTGDARYEKWNEQAAA